MHQEKIGRMCSRNSCSISFIITHESTLGIYNNTNIIDNINHNNNNHSKYEKSASFSLHLQSSTELDGTLAAVGANQLNIPFINLSESFPSTSNNSSTITTATSSLSGLSANMIMVSSNNNHINNNTNTYITNNTNKLEYMICTSINDAMTLSSALQPTRCTFFRLIFGDKEWLNSTERCSSWIQPNLVCVIITLKNFLKNFHRAKIRAQLLESLEDNVKCFKGVLIRRRASCYRMEEMKAGCLIMEENQQKNLTLQRTFVERLI
ncbi:hypothetical protein HELRODRAFT_169504 [Helobdella robusta]|uniref:Uncharacterized protein n=1 Tax=Helobdella robusta TaxID=6412 RepID=T1F209_HELRO|nr:hypothetical protein HELRODRAFT_169504 [Helobdella robusta]ESO08624.1 hypothetical protein HELRODRAFT_169504 [Helobdella robusta]